MWINNFFRFSLTAILSLLLYSCLSPYRISNQNMAFLYKTDNGSMRPEFLIYRYHDDSCKLYCKIFPEKFLATKNPETSFSTRINISVQLLSSYDTDKIVKVLTDSISKEIRTPGHEEPQAVIKTLNFSVPGVEHLLLRIIISDINSRKSSIYFAETQLGGNTTYASSSFLLTEKNSKTPYFNNYLDSTDAFTLHCRNKGMTNARVYYYRRHFPIASPPFAVSNQLTFEYKPDSIFYIKIENSYRFIKEGFYFIQTDTGGREGFSIFRFRDQFLKLNKPEQLIEPVRYITEKKEYENIRDRINPKQAIDNFWLSIGGDPERTKQIIKKYYTRVQDANLYFTSYIEGWKTDRGMIFTIFGAPNTIYRNANGESWIYGDAGNMQSLVFTFSKVINPFTENDYLLNRSPLYQQPWYMAVEAWREGRIFNE